MNTLFNMTSLQAFRSVGRAAYSQRIAGRKFNLTYIESIVNIFVCVQLQPLPYWLNWYV